ncbi:hypothetical protein ScPMuIL_008174 [Solemya velum]
MSDKSKKGGRSPYEQGELASSPEIVELDDPDEESDSVHSESAHSIEAVEDERDVIEIKDKEDPDDSESLDIKPPQAQAGKKEKSHKHKHKEEKRKEKERERHLHDRDRDRERNRDRERDYDNVREKELHRDREREKRRIIEEKSSHRDKRDLRETLREKEKERERRKIEDREAEKREAEKRERSRMERERLERLERERLRERRARQEQEERQRKELERKKRRDDEKERLAIAAARNEEKLRKEKEFAMERYRSRSRSNSRDRDRVRNRDHDRDHSRDRRKREQRRDDSRSRQKRRSMERETRPVRAHTPEYSHKKGEVMDSVMSHSPDVTVQEEASGSEEHSAESESEASEDTDTDSDSGSPSESSSNSGASSKHSEYEEDEHVVEKHEKHKKEAAKVTSKFDDHSDNGSFIDSPPESDIEAEGDDYIEDTPPQSPIELKPDLPPYFPAIQGCRSVEEFNCLNRIEEGTYGVVYRARDKKTEEIVALKRLKMEKEKEGFPITSLREINTLLKAQHQNIVTVREIVVGSSMDKIYIVMDYVEHDLKSLMDTMKNPFLVGEVKTLLIQLLKGVAHLHDNWIIHRDLKTSNLLLSHKGILKVGDFGLAREYGSPLKHYTPIVVTLWYRAPELLLGIKEYSTQIDMWSVGCIMAELLNMKALWPGKSEIDQLQKIFKDLGTPNEKIWTGVMELPGMKKCTFTEYPYNTIRQRFGSYLTDVGFDLLNRFLTYNPGKRITAEESLKHDYFKESPLPVDPSMFPTWPAKSEQPRRHASSPRPPSGGKAYAKLVGDDDESAGFHLTNAAKGVSAKGPGFTLKF